MKLGIYSLKEILYQGGAVSLTCPTTSGEITVLDQHAPLISVLKGGTIKIIDKSNTEHYVRVSSGFLEVQRNTVKVLIE